MKEEVINDYLSENSAYADIIKKYEISSDSILVGWINKYNGYEKLMNGVVKNIIDNMSLDNNPIILPFGEYVDIDYLVRCNSPKEIYDYLKSIDPARLSLPLHYLYLLLEFDKMTIFKD